MAKFKLGMTIKTFGTNLRKYWNTPRKDECISNKEFMNFCIGASGSNMVSSVIGYVTFASACFLVGTIYEIAFRDVWIIGIVGIPFTYLTQPINMLITDNLGSFKRKTGRTINIIASLMIIIAIALYFIPQTLTEVIMPSFPQIVANFLLVGGVNIFFRIFVLKKMSKKYGKFRPWIIAGAIPALVIVCLIVYLPFKDIIYFNRLWILHLLFSMYGVFGAFASQVSNLHNVVSYNTNERARLQGIGSWLYGTLSVVFGTLYPILAIYTGGQTNLKTYRVFIPIFFIVGALASLFLAFGVKERVILEQEHKPNVNMRKGFKEVLRNKYFWIMNISGLANAITTGSYVLVNLMFVYVTRQEWMLGVFALLTTFAYDPGLLLGPWLIKKFGKKKVCIVSKLIGLGGTVFILISMNVGSGILFIIANFVSILVVTPQGVAQSTMNADIWDYQQHISGERLDGCSGIFTLILLPFTMLFGALIPFVYGEIGLTSDFEVLFVDDIRTKIVNITVMVSLIAGIISTIPFFFYDLSEQKHRDIILALKEKANIGDGNIEDGNDIAEEMLSIED